MIEISIKINCTMHDLDLYLYAQETAPLFCWLAGWVGVAAGLAWSSPGSTITSGHYEYGL